MTDIDEIITKVESRFCDLDEGSHDTAERGCIMELVSWAAGEPWTDFPACVPRGVALHCQRIHDAAKPFEYASIWTRDRLAGVLALPHGEDAMRRRAYIAAEHARTSAVHKLRAYAADATAAAYAAYAAAAAFDAADAADAARQRARIEILDLWIADARRNA